MVRPVWRRRRNRSTQAAITASASHNARAPDCRLSPTDRVAVGDPTDGARSTDCSFPDRPSILMCASAISIFGTRPEGLLATRPSPWSPVCARVSVLHAPRPPAPCGPGCRLPLPCEQVAARTAIHPWWAQAGPCRIASGGRNRPRRGRRGRARSGPNTAPFAFQPVVSSFCEWIETYTTALTASSGPSMV